MSVKSRRQTRRGWNFSGYDPLLHNARVQRSKEWERLTKRVHAASQAMLRLGSKTSAGG